VLYSEHINSHSLSCCRKCFCICLFRECIVAKQWQTEP